MGERVNGVGRLALAVDQGLGGVLLERCAGDDHSAKRRNSFGHLT